MSKFGNMGHPDKLSAFMQIISAAQRTPNATGVQFIVEYDPFTRDKFKLSLDDLKNLKYTYIDILLNDEVFCSWWEIESAAIIFEL